MMSKEDAQTPAGGQSNRKTAAAAARPQDQQNLKCPRCDSPNTKFCYYNNYSLTQPRHFCKTCRRYWTKGGALRNVPIGGGCRKNKKVKSSSSSSRLSSDSASKLLDTSSSSDFGGLKFFHGLVSPAMDFQLGGSGLSFPSTNSLDPSLMGFNNNTNNYPVINPPHASNGFLLGGAIQGMGSLNVNSSLASSIESLSSINQDLHWKLQQQRLGVLFGSGEINTNHQKGTATAVSAAAARAVVSPVVTLESQVQKPQPILFQNLDVSKPDGNSNLRKEGGNGESSNAGATEWFFGNSYAPVAGSSTPTNSSGNGNDHNNTSGNWNNGVQLWSDLHHQYSGLP